MTPAWGTKPQLSSQPPDHLLLYYTVLATFDAELPGAVHVLEIIFMSPTGSSSTTQHAVYNIPLALDNSSLRTLGPDPDYARSRNASLLADCQRSIVGAMPVQEFIDYFLPLATEDDRIPAPRLTFESVPARGSEAADIYQPLVSCFQSLYSISLPIT